MNPPVKNCAGCGVPYADCADCGTPHDHVLHHARIAERIAEAVARREITMEDAFETLSMHNRAAETQRAADALTAYRNGEPVCAWPANAPWAGFGDAEKEEPR